MSGGDLLLRFTLVAPPADVLFSLLNKDNQPVNSCLSAGDDLTFRVAVRVGEKPDKFSFLGEFVRNSGGRRYIYYASGRQAGQEGSCWDRRGKVMLDAIDSTLVEQSISTGKELQGRFPGKAGDGGPSCGAVQPIDGWNAAPG